jgi:hypothetical protein
MPPLEQATQKVAEWTETLAYRTDGHGKSSELTRVAQERYTY